MKDLGYLTSDPRKPFGLVRRCFKSLVLMVLSAAGFLFFWSLFVFLKAY